MSAEPPPSPLLVLPSPERINERARRWGGPSRFSRPDSERLRQRLAPRFERLQQSFEARRAELRADLTGTDPEQIIVLETIGTVAEFIRAVQRIPGLEFLGEFEEEDIPPDEDFYVERNPEQPLRGTLYLLMTNQQGLEQLLALWQRHVDAPDDSFPRNLGRFKQLFSLLHDVRVWGPEDRLRETGVLADWEERIRLGAETVPTEIELWFRGGEQDRGVAEDEVRAHVAQAGGEVLATSTIPAIRYHAVLARLPIQAVQPLFEDVAAVELLRNGSVMFLRPTGQSVVAPVETEGLPWERAESPPDELADPVVALLDGMPLATHDALAGRVDIDDPDDFSADTPAQRRRHGTAMASLLTHGDLAAPGPPLTSRLYVRPILQAGPAWVHDPPEQIPDEVLTVDLIHRAVRRIFEGEGDTPPVAPTVRVINLSVGDPFVPFVRMMSPWARLLDWLAWRYQVLIVVSAGNHPTDVTLDIEPDRVATMSTDELQAATIRFLADHNRARRLLPPSEAVNALTIGANPDDGSVPSDGDPRRELIRSPHLPAPYSALGLGYRRSIKPDVLMPGGRGLYEMRPAAEGATTTTFVLTPQPRSAPGHQVASPVGTPGTRQGLQYWHGTSNAAALASRAAAQLQDLLVQLRDDGAEFLADRGTFTGALKALLVHGAQHNEASSVLAETVGEQTNPQKWREFVCRFLGYGRVDTDLIFAASAQRATMVGGGRIPAEAADLYRVPLPPGLSGQTGRRRLTVTLAWLTPANPRDHRYRRARLWFDPPRDQLILDRKEADWRAVQRGTVQHEILEGERASAFTDGDVLEIQVNCAADAGDPRDEIPYALAVSLEVGPELDVSVRNEVQERIRPPIAMRPSP